MLSKIFGGLVLEYSGEKPYHISTNGYQVTLPNGRTIEFDWNCTEGNSVPGTNRIELGLSDFDGESLDSLQIRAAELVESIQSGKVTEINFEAVNQKDDCINEQVKVKEFFIEFEDKRFDLINLDLITQQLINIYWSDTTNEKMVQQTREFMSLNCVVPDSVKNYVEVILPTDSKFPALAIIEPYGESLEKLQPQYYAAKRSLFYKEI
ncbi:hypothetical protein AWM68_17360 [Fictibacillus phosphorivorans]|uniref:Uncharacterized protein n=1 Tax=Fictibacillus phosphorivorans TaxID=1221500 RepID=A0A161TPJ2_9BACL|nr:hypothetical protein [Fictibacillus phosphorivorans]KZE67941.1 hypothetical protein AWM68_17360 [Fictibacillus phosphorivorans]